MIWFTGNNPDVTDENARISNITFQKHKKQTESWTKWFLEELDKEYLRYSMYLSLRKTTKVEISVSVTTHDGFITCQSMSTKNLGRLRDCYVLLRRHLSNSIEDQRRRKFMEEVRNYRGDKIERAQ